MASTLKSPIRGWPVHCRAIEEIDRAGHKAATTCLTVGRSAIAMIGAR